MNSFSETTDRRVKKSKKAMQQSLLEWMEEKDFASITVTNVVERADVNRGTFYKHYDYKEQLLEEIMDGVTDDLKEAFRKPYKNKATLELPKLTVSSVKIFEHVLKHRCFYTLVLTSNTLAGFQHKLASVLQELILGDLLHEAEDDGIDRALQAGYHSHAIFGMIVEWVRGGFEHQPDYMSEQLLLILRSRPADIVFKAGSP
ncbi:TetR/AcrR family transcriptional regulator [Marinococcus luteus]|uniref:TetR/AcrR family transcriptional regulator n=1 Tax=Marinococcus luteus TaxID=1122204 RepID=UPI002ACCE2C9|nr:TetR/AcrR family transcriptional regulator [Marinococcus luteus]MDZ5783369.1 TetR/AcrR family transcriptional regulator [Marinococcus luteus]